MGHSYTLGEIASRVGGTVAGDAGRKVDGVQPLDLAGPEHLSFLAHPRYRTAAESSRAGAILVRAADRVPGRDLIVVENPYTALAAALGLFHPPGRPVPGVSPHAVIAGTATLGAGVSIGPIVTVGEGCTIGDGSVLMPGVVLGDWVEVGRDTVLHPGVVVYARSVIGDRVVIHAGSVVGSDGFGFGEEEGGRAKIPQVGIVKIEDDVEIGACTTIDRATFGATVIGCGSRIDNLVQIAHNVVIGAGSVLVAQTGVAGSTRLGRSVVMAGQSGAAGHLTIGDRAIIGARAAVLRDLEPGAFVLGYPATDHRDWKKAQVTFARLPDLLRRVLKIERSLDALGRRAAPGSARTRRTAGSRLRSRKRRAGADGSRAGAVRRRKG
jgi:UDP-3-O-[3-hydroxymyristoyl] glucosamine N-acyltransferase